MRTTKESLSGCPACAGALQIESYRCPACQTEVRGKFRPCSFCQLSDEERYLALVFVQCEGSIKDVERIMGISYPTVKNRLAKLRTTLQSGAVNAPLKSEPAPEARNAVLDALERGDIEFPEAMARLQQTEND